MSNFVLTDRGELARTHKNDHRFWAGGRIVQAVAFTHPKKGDHVIYVDVSRLDPAGIPSKPVYEALANLLSQVI
jgi:hypothetical protein